MTTCKNCIHCKPGAQSNESLEDGGTGTLPNKLYCKINPPQLLYGFGPHAVWPGIAVDEPACSKAEKKA